MNHSYRTEQSYIAWVKRFISFLEGIYWMIACLLYGSGLRLMEAVRLRIQHIDIDYRQIWVRDGKGKKDRVVMLPQKLILPIQNQIQKVRLIHQLDLREGFGAVYLPFALERKYHCASKEFIGQYLFPADKRSMLCDPSDRSRVWYSHDSGVAGSQGCKDNDEIHPCNPKGKSGRAEPGGFPSQSSHTLKRLQPISTVQ